MAFVDIGLDLQILICTLLHPSDILTLRKTCKTLLLVTRRRTIWIDALRRVCLENTLFLPSFPMLDMSDVELEQAAIAPRRWIELSTPFATRGPSGSEVRIYPTTTRIIDDPFPSKRVHNIILVPGGRYLVCFSLDGLGVWDLGYIPSANCRLIASVGPEGGSTIATGNVHATPDGMGLVIFLHRRGIEDYSFYEIYPQSENPQLIKIACLEIVPPRYYLRSYVSPDKVIWFDPHDIQEITFTVWDYRLNASVSFVALVDVEDIRGNAKVVATQTAIVVLNEEAIFIWAIPPLLPQPPDFDDYGLTRKFPPLIRVRYPDGLSLSPLHATWRTLSSWYFDPSKPLYFDKVYTRCSQLQRFKLIIEPDFSDATLHFINTIQLASHASEWELSFQSKLCEDTLVINWNFSGQGRIYTGSALSRPILNGNPSMTKILLPVDRPREISICPASGRLVHLYSGRHPDKIVVFDFLPHQRL